jgi:regulatory protein
MTAGYRDDLVEGAIERLTELGILDDEVFTAAWIDSRDRARPRGERALRVELQRKGVDRALIDEALEARRPEPGGDHDPDLAAAERLLQRHVRTLVRIPDPRLRRQRAYALLVRNGFDPETAGRLAASVAGPFAKDGHSGELAAP